MHSLYTNAGSMYHTGTRQEEEEEEEDDYENEAPPYKDLPPKPSSFAPPRPPRAGNNTEILFLPGKVLSDDRPRLQPCHLLISPAGHASGAISMPTICRHPSLPPSPATPVPWLNLRSGSPGSCQEKRLLVHVCVLVATSLLLSCVGLAVTLIKYQEMADKLRKLTLQQVAWQANVTGMAGLAGLKKDLDKIRSDTNQSLVELRGLLDCTRVICPEGWVPFEGKCYYFSQSTKSWDGALVFCQENFSHLVIINSFAEQDFVSKAHGSPRVYWLGLSDRKQEGDWRWLDGSAVSLSFWDVDEPNNSFEEDCASMNKDGTWNDLPCYRTSYWICERKHCC